MLRNARRRGAARMLGFVVACTCALVLMGLAIVRGLDALGGPTPDVDVASLGLQLKVLDLLAHRDPDRPETRVAFLSDSTSMHFPEGALGLNNRLELALVEQAPEASHFRVISFASPGYTPFTQYFLSHRVADAGPDQVVLGFNLAALSPGWRKVDRPELAALLPVSALAEALRLPLYWIGLSTDELLLYTLVAHWEASRRGCGSRRSRPAACASGDRSPNGYRRAAARRMASPIRRCSSSTATSSSSCPFYPSGRLKCSRACDTPRPLQARAPNIRSCVLCARRSRSSARIGSPCSSTSSR